MSARDREDMAAAQHVVREPLRPGNVPLSAVEDRLHQRIAAGDDVADYPKVRLQRNLVFAEPLGELDAERRELIAHRRINIRIAAGDSIAGGARDRRNAAHERAANAEDMEVLGTQGGGLAAKRKSPVLLNARGCPMI